MSAERKHTETFVFIMLGKWRRKHRIGGRGTVTVHGYGRRLWRHMCRDLREYRMYPWTDKFGEPYYRDDEKGC